MSEVKLEHDKDHPVYVAVENCGLINYGVHLFPTPEEAVKWWREYTKLEPPKTEHEAEEIGQDEDYGECRIYRVHCEVDETGVKKWISEDYLWLLIPETE